MHGANDVCLVRVADFHDHHHLQAVLDGASGTRDARVFGLSSVALLREHHIFLGFLNEVPVGCIMATLGRTTLLHGLSVVQEHRRQGHAATLLATAMAEIGRDHAPEAFWTAVVPDEQGVAERFLRLGFTYIDDETCCDLRHLHLSVRRADQSLGMLAQARCS